MRGQELGTEHRPQSSRGSGEAHQAGRRDVGRHGGDFRHRQRAPRHGGAGHQQRRSCPVDAAAELWPSLQERVDLSFVDLQPEKRRVEPLLVVFDRVLDSLVA